MTTRKTGAIVGAALLLAAGGAAAADRPPSEQPSPELGKQVFQKWCAPCHAPGDGHPGTVALEAKYKGALPAPLEQRTDLTADTVKYFVRNGVSIMPFFRKTEISDAELDALGRYLEKK
jgi:mono/diheme cytochrome c family protein